MSIVNLAHERMRRSPVAELTYAIVLEAIANVFARTYPDRAAEIDALGEELTISIDLVSGVVSLKPAPLAYETK